MGKGYQNAPASNTAATFTISDGIGENGCVELEHLFWSLDATPAAGVNLKVESPAGTIIFQVDVSTQGVGFIPFSGWGSPGRPARTSW